MNELLILQVTGISWESPGIAMWTGNMYKIWEVPKVFDGHFAIPTVGIGASHTFTLGDVTANPQLVSFGIAVRRIAWNTSYRYCTRTVTSNPFTTT